MHYCKKCNSIAPDEHFFTCPHLPDGERREPISVYPQAVESILRQSPDIRTLVKPLFLWMNDNGVAEFVITKEGAKANVNIKLESSGGENEGKDHG